MMEIEELPVHVQQEVKASVATGFRLADVRVMKYERSREYVLTFTRGRCPMTMRVRILRMEFFPAENKTVHHGSIDLFEMDLQRAAYVAGYEKMLLEDEGA